MKTTKQEVIQAGKDLASRSTPVQQENHKAVMAWIESLDSEQIPDYHSHKEGRSAGGMLAYKLLIRSWMARG